MIDAAERLTNPVFKAYTEYLTKTLPIDKANKVIDAFKELKRITKLGLLYGVDDDFVSELEKVVSLFRQSL